MGKKGEKPDLVAAEVMLILCCSQPLSMTVSLVKKLGDKIVIFEGKFIRMHCLKLYRELKTKRLSGEYIPK